MRWRRWQGDTRVLHRFALLPRHDPPTGICYWLEWIEIHQERIHDDIYSFWITRRVLPGEA